MTKDLRSWCAALLLLGACGDPPRTAPVKTDRAGTPAPAKAPEADLAERYLAAKERIAALLPTDTEGPKRILAEIGPGLRETAEKAADLPLRANASLLLGSLHERAGDRRSAISFYRQAAALLKDEVEPHRVLALALAADGKHLEAIPEQEIVVRDDPDDLEAWLLLGELNIKAKREEDAGKAYAAYEARRKGLIDGLTLQNKDGTWILPVEQRAACARALIPARENGTALALLYSLGREPDPAVRLALAEAMGTQRLAAYKQPLTDKLAGETDPEAKAAMVWALQEIERDPLDARPGPAPVTPGAGTDKAPEAGSKEQGAGDSAAPGEKAPADGEAPAEGKAGGEGAGAGPAAPRAPG